MRSLPDARAGHPGVVISLVVLLLAVSALAGACAPEQPQIPTGRRVWDGPSNIVASRGVIMHERREIAQRVPLPSCVTVGADEYRFTEVTPFQGGANPPGLNDTFYRLDRWRLWTRSGPVEGQPVLFVTIRGSTGIIAEYARVPEGQTCTA